MPKNKAKEIVKNLNRTVGGVVINQKGAIKELETTCGSIYTEFCRVNGAQSYIASQAEKEVQTEIQKVNTPPRKGRGFFLPAIQNPAPGPQT